MQAVRIRPVPAESDKWYRTVIVDFTTDEELIVQMPDENDREGDPEADESASGEDESAAREDTPAPQPATVGDDVIPPPIFERGTNLEVEISFPDGIRRFTSVVRRLDVKFGGAMRIEWPEEGTRIQRRDFVRVDVAFRAIIWYREGEGSLKKTTGATMDISAGGVRLKLIDRLESGQRIEIEIDTPLLKERTVQGRVVHVGEVEVERGAPQEYWVAVEFVGVGEALRNEMTQMVFDIQRDQRKRSLA